MKTDFSVYLEKKFKNNNLILNTKNLDELYNNFDEVYSNLTKEFLDNYEREDIKFNGYHNYKKTTLFSDKTTITINYNNQIVKLNIYHNNDTIDNFINTILLVIYFMIEYSNYNTDILIDYLLTDELKIINDFETNKIFTKQEINSGLTDFRKNKIIIWRKEEIMKVTIHELIHLLRLGIKKTSSKLINHYKKKYKVSSDNIILDEAYTEFLAVLINSFLITKFTNNNFNYFKYLLKLEIYFSIFQSKKILYLSRKNQNDYIHINNYTQVLSYYIIKLELFMNLEEVIKIINLKNLKDLENLLINFKKTVLNNSIIVDLDTQLFRQMRMTLNEFKLF
tara:strand:+ start:247 stop:1257 length:1011 start_codon:yes stop_codon:yes gene_type:complete